MPLERAAAWHGLFDVSPGLPGASQQQSRPLQRHQGGGNFAYADGHAKWTRLAKTWRSYTDNDWGRSPTPP